VSVISVKISDVAEKAGVSVSTVSRVLNGGKFVRKEIYDQVQDAIRELGYTPSLIARSLVLQKTNLIGVIVPDITSSFCSTILRGIGECSDQYGYNIIMCNIEDKVGHELKYFDIFDRMRVDGIILMHDRINDDLQRFLKTHDIPIVLCSASLPGFNYPAVNIDDYRAAYDAVNYLISQNHKRIAMISGIQDDVGAGVKRYVGFIDAMKNAGLEVRREYIKRGNYKIGDGYRQMEELLSCDELPTAVFAVSDDMAVGAMNCVIDHGMSVPGDISIIGFDDSEIASSVRPALTTIHQPIREIGIMSVELLLKKINHEQIPISSIILDHQLVLRGSCRKIEA
jgi:LacI family transcriptional regulator